MQSKGISSELTPYAMISIKKHNIYMLTLHFAHYFSTPKSRRLCHDEDIVLKLI